MNEYDLIRLDLKGYSRGQLTNYLMELHNRQRQKRIETDVLAECVRDVSMTLHKGSVV